MDFKDSNFQNLITSLLLNGNFMQNSGLLHGKTGLAVLFYHLSRESGNHAFEYFAGELIDDICSNLTTKMPLDFENGLAGIGWGVEYLVQNQFLAADTDEILEEIDYWIFLEFLKNPPAKIDLLNGIVGIGYYFLMRVRDTNQKRNSIIKEINKNALLQICNFISLRLADFNNLYAEPQKPIIHETNKSFNIDNDPVPFFDVTCNLPILIGFLTELNSVQISKTTINKLLINVLTSLNYDSNLPKLQCNRLLLQLSLMKLKNIFQTTYDKTSDEWNSAYVIKIQRITKSIISKLIFTHDDDKYTNELTNISLSIRTGLSGLALSYKLLYAQTNDIEYNKEFKRLLSTIQSDTFIKNFNYDYSNRVKMDEKKMGILEGISGLLLVALCDLNV